jgi:hypothetical protein
MEILGLIIFVLIAIGVLFKKSPAELEEAKLNAISKIQKLSDEQIKKGYEEEDSDHRDLNKDALIMLPIGNNIFTMMDTIKNSFDPLIRLIVAYLWIEGLHPDSAEKNDEDELINTGVDLLAYELCKANLTDTQMHWNFSDDEPGEDKDGYFTKPIFWLDGVHNAINAALVICGDMESKTNVCAEVVGVLLSTIEDDALLTQFAEIARKCLKSKNLYTEEAEASLAGLEL